MKKYLQKKLNNEKGMTLIELLAVIVIIAIIAAIAIPAIGNVIENSKYSAAKSDALNTLSAANIYFAENPTKTTVTTATLKAGYLDNAGKIPVTLVGTEAVPTSNFIAKNTAGELEITTNAFVYSGTKTLAFSGATVAEINSDADVQKGSDANNKTVPKTN
ncbi:prepilin-type N-terminal cleavage/methylation domain-containing protein [Planococcus sp. SE5232]|uniref:prepilin-type N-terminal cleavage/methylation domain-containing protein n=1 Tax=unclassified Planococcus (in: firmicutes) TaxID=2662419 RepID=UPI003D6A1EA0